MKLTTVLGAAALALTALSPGAALAQPAPGPPKLTTHLLRGGVYWVEGGISNTGFIVGPTGVVVIDSQRSPAGARVELAEIAKITAKPVNTVVLTHVDPDHVAGLSGFAPGMAIIAHENSRAEILASAADPSGGPLTAVYQEIAAHNLPNRTIGESEAMTLDGVRMQLIHVAPAHTAGDLMIYLPVQKVLFAGDIITTNAGRYPVIHTGGSSLGWIASMKAALALDVATYVGGHGAFETKTQLRARLSESEARRAAVKVMVQAGKTLAEVEAALPEPGANPMFASFTRTVYDELTKGYPPQHGPWTNIIHH